MSEPRRLKDETQSALARALLESAAVDRSTAGAQKRVISAIGIGTIATSAAATVAAKAGASTSGAAASAAKNIGLLVAKWGALAAIGGGVVIGVHHQMHAVPVPVAAPSVAALRPSAVVVPPAVAASTRSDESTTTLHAEPPARRLAARRSATAPGTASRPPPTEVTAVSPPKPFASTISAQTRALDVVRREIAAHDGPRALASLDDFEVRYPTSRLTEEVTVLRIDALVASGRRDEAAVRGQAFLERSPQSAYADHIRSTLADP